jgi:putative MFS transporter
LQKELLGSALIVGLLIGGLLVGRLSDRIGRKLSIQLALLATAIAEVMAALSPTVNFLIFCKVLGGIGTHVRAYYNAQYAVNVLFVRL